MAKESGWKVVASNRKRATTTTSRTSTRPVWSSPAPRSSLRAGRCSLVDGFAQFSGGELWLEGVHIPEYTQGTWTNHAPPAPLCCSMGGAGEDPPHSEQKGRTIVPLSLYFRTVGPRSRSPWPWASASMTSATRCARQDRLEAERAMSASLKSRA